MTQQQFTLAAAHHQAGRLDQAENLYRKILAADPENVEVLHRLGALLIQAGRADAALPIIRRTIALQPNRPEHHLHLCAALLALGRPEEGQNACARALELRPERPEAWFNFGCAAGARLDWDRAISAYRRAIAIKPDYAEANYNLGDALVARGDWPEATKCFARAAELKPFPQALNNLANGLQIQGKFNEAIEAYRQAIALKPDFAEVHSNLGNALWLAGRMREAADSCRAALALRPDFDRAQTNLGNALLGMGHVAEAVDAFRKSIHLPDAGSNLLYTLHFLPDLDPAAIYREHIEWDKRHAQPLINEIRPHENDRDPDRRLRVGFVSPDFREHSVSFFVESLLSGRDPKNAEVYAYAVTSRPDAVTARLQKLVPQWRNITAVSDQNVAEMIRKDQIDILVDLAGHTAGNRLLVFARKPAPIQVTYLGYPDATGLSAMDYRLTDVHADPPGMTEQFYSEELLRLPRSFICYRPPSDSPEVGALPALRKGFITFGSFNHLAKINTQVVDLWSQILKRVPNSRILIKNVGLEDDSTRNEMLERFAAHAIEASRVDLRAKAATYVEHLNLYNEMDIALDTFPYNGTTTSCEAMWMGVPMVTLAGEHHAGRVGLSLLTNIELPQLIAKEPAEYVDAAVKLSADTDNLAAIRLSLRERLADSGLLDAPNFAGDVEAIWRDIWRRYCAR